MQNNAGKVPLNEYTQSDSIQLLTFMLDDEVYAADINQVQEVLEFRKITKVPKTPDFLLGVINLRGHVVPVIDLRRQFKMKLRDVSVNTCIVIIDVLIEGEKIPLGILADAVKEVIELSVSDISVPPKIGTRIDTSFISGIGKNHDGFVIILNLPQVISYDKIQTAYEAVQLDHVSQPNNNTTSSN